ncbi:MAG: 4Fe-4S dicluster-binding protein [Candidatus Diapherotrites archaeon]
MSKIIPEEKLRSQGLKGVPYSVAGKNIPNRGSWRTHVPKFDDSKCIKCGLCWLQCPDNAIKEKKDGFYESDSRLCKGCFICAKICPVKAIEMVREKK